MAGINRHSAHIMESIAIAVVAAFTGSLATALVMRRMYRQHAPDDRKSVERRRSSSSHYSDGIEEALSSLEDEEESPDSLVFADEHDQNKCPLSQPFSGHEAQQQSQLQANSTPLQKLLQRQSSQSSAASSLPSDSYFEQFEEYENENNKSGNSEYIDRVGSLNTVRRSILKRRSLLLQQEYNNNSSEWQEYEEEGWRRRQSSCESLENTELLEPTTCSTTLSNNTASTASCSYQIKHRAFDTYQQQRRRSSTRTRRFSARTLKNSITDSMSTLDDEDPVDTPYHYSMEKNNSYITCERQKSEEDSYISQTERQFKGKEYESGYDTVLELATDYNTSIHLLRRTRVVSALAHRLLAAADETACIEEVTTLMALVFGLDRVSFAMSTGSDHFVLKRIEVKRKMRDENGKDDDASFNLSDEPPLLELEYKDSDFKRPYEGTAAGIVVKTLREHYTPKTQHSHFATHKVFYSQGLNSVLATPILVHGYQCMGVILLSKQEEDAFPKLDRILISDIATLLGANIYAKRLRKASEDANKLSREMLHSFVPPKVLQKIECFWDSSSSEYKKLNAAFNSTTSLSPESSICNKSIEPEMVKSNSWYVANTDWSEAQIEEYTSRLKQNEPQGKLEMLKKLNRDESFNDQDVIITTKGLDLEAELSMTSRALYAETVRNVSIIFTDIVGFSRIAMGVTPIRVMNMLQDLFSRFDQLCDVHGVMKLETIGDAYICASNLLEENADDINVAQNAAIRALEMAKDMIFEARKVQVPISRHAASRPNDSIETLEIRVGIHVGDITCGVLGQRVPKFTLCGTSVNLAARMEQSSRPCHIRSTSPFHDLIGDNEKGWQEKETVAIKNMGEVETYLLNPYNSTLKSCLET